MPRGSMNLLCPLLCFFTLSDGVANEGAGLEQFELPPGFTIERIAGPEQVSYGMCAALDARGRLFVTHSTGENMSGDERIKNPVCGIRLLEDRDGDGNFETSKVFADKLTLPMGVLHHQGSLFVASPPEFLRFEDTDGDGVADLRTTLLKGWNVKNTASLHGPFLGPDGYLYLTHGRHGYDIITLEGEDINGLAARIYRCRPDGSMLERISGGGFDNPVELAFTPGGELFCTMTYIVDPKEGLSPAGMRDALIHIVEGAVFPKYHECVKEFLLTGQLMTPMVELARVAPAGFLRYRSEAFGPEYVGNFFSAQFNPHSVHRHRVTPRGATYVATDEPFLTSSDPDFHPTDVIEDADGSLIVVDTGGWYLQACPISTIAKPDVKGGIYRIKRKSAPSVADPRGTQLKLAAQSADQLCQWLDDPRFAVRDEAVERLVAAGQDAIATLQKAYESSSSARARRNAVWCLSRIVAPHAFDTVRAALHDPDDDVRMAATRAVGIQRDGQASTALAKILLTDKNPGIRRQAATALGRIGKPDATAPLLSAQAETADRFLEHAITNALFHTADPDQLTSAIDKGAPSGKRAALYALQQVHPDALRRESLPALLKIDDAPLRETVLWVLGNHPNWSGDIVGYLKQWLSAPDLPAEQLSAVRNSLLAFSTNPKIQQLVVDTLADSDAPLDRRAVLLETIGLFPAGELPQAWTQQLASALRDASSELRSNAIATIRTRSLTDFDEILIQLSGDSSQPNDLRLGALAVCAPRLPELTDDLFRFLSNNLSADTPPLLRVSAAESLAKAKLSDPQRFRLLDHIAAADPLTFSPLLNAFTTTENEELGKRLAATLLDAQAEDAEPLTGDRLNRLFAGYPSAVQEAARPLYDLAEAATAAQIKRMEDLLPLAAGGNARRGQVIFNSEAAACISCHRVGEDGGRIGPDLTKVGSVRSGRDLLESIVFPSASFAQGYEPYLIEDQDGFVYEGVITRQTSDTLTLRSAANAEVRLDRKSIAEITPATVSIMPQGLEKALTPQQLQDLLAYLLSLK